MNRLYPQPDSPDSLEGTAAHWVFSEMLAGVIITEGMKADNGVFVTEEMIEGAELLVDYVRSKIPADAVLHVEERLAIPNIHEQCFGTPDVWAFDHHTMTLFNVDYKFGHRFVDEFENDQGVCYIDGILVQLAEYFDTPVGELDQRIVVKFTIIQPRCFYRGEPVRTWSIMARDIRGQVNQLKSAAELSLVDNPTATTNEYCSDCNGRHACPALQQAAYSDAEFSVQSSPVELPPEAASLELHMLERSLDRLQARVSGLKEAVGEYGRQGKPTPYHKLEQGYGRQGWTVPPDQVINMGQLMGIDLAKKAVITPKQAIKSGIDEGVVAAYSQTPLGSIKLISCNPSDVRRVFK